MSAASSTFQATETPTAASWRSAAVVRGIGLIGVVKGFARSVLGLGQVMSGAIARLEREGADPYSANSGFDFKGVMNLLQRAVLMADALRARLRTPAVALALARFGVGRASARQERPQPAEPPELDDTMLWITYLRTDDKRRQGWREAIEGLSDREVLTHIYGDLLHAASMLGETDVAQEVRALACKASALLGDEADEVAPGDTAPDDVSPDTAAIRPAAHATPDEGPDPERMQGTRPTVPEVGRGPP